jgi:hypothetical protein
MKRIILIGTLFLFGFQAFSQAKLNIKWDKPEYLFYQTQNLKNFRLP